MRVLGVGLTLHDRRGKKLRGRRGDDETVARDEGDRVGQPGSRKSALARRRKEALWFGKKNLNRGRVARRARTLSHLWHTRLPRTPGPTTRRLRSQLLGAFAAATTCTRSARERRTPDDPRVQRVVLATGDESERAAPPPTACLHASLTSAERTVARPQVCMDVPGLETRRSRPCASGTDEVRQSRK